MNFALLDDQISYHSEFKEITKRYINLSNCTFYIDSQELFKGLKKPDNLLDVLFLDINLKTESGIALAQKLRVLYPSIIIIFLTDQNHLVYKSFGLNVFKFIYKPTFRHLVDSLFLAINDEINLLKTIVIKTPQGITSISKKELILVSREKRKILFYLIGNKQIETNFKSIQEVKNILDSDSFVLINRSEIVNINYITEITNMLIRLKFIANPRYASTERLAQIKKMRMQHYV